MRAVWGDVLVAGIGGVGGYFGGLLARSFRPERAGPEGEGLRVTFLARGTHLEAIRSHGLRLKTGDGRTLVCRPGKATDRLEEVGTPALCLVCVKGYDLAEVSRGIAAIAGERTIVMPLLNGVDIRERIREHLETGLVLPACVYMSARIERPGVVTQQGVGGVLVFGEDPEHPGFDPSPVEGLFKRAGITVQFRRDAYPAIWEKYLFISSFALVTAWAGQPFGGVLGDAKLRALVGEIVGEISAIAGRRGVRLAAPVSEMIERCLQKAGAFPPDTRSSYQRDVERGGRTEGDLFGGTIVRLGRSLGVPTPSTARLYAEISRRLSPEGR